MILGNHRPFRAVRMSNVDLLNWVEQPKNPSLFDPCKIIVKADNLTMEPGG